MPFTKFIEQSPQDFGAALKVSGFRVRNEPRSAPLEEPFYHNAGLPRFASGEGINSSVLVASGQFFKEDPTITWQLVNPLTDLAVPPDQFSIFTPFKGFEVAIYSETGELVKQLETGDYRNNYYSLAVNEIVDAFGNLHSTNSSGLNIPASDPRRFRLRVVAHDYYNRTNTGIYFLTSPSPDVIGLRL